MSVRIQLPVLVSIAVFVVTISCSGGDSGEGAAAVLDEVGGNGFPPGYPRGDT